MNTENTEKEKNLSYLFICVYPRAHLPRTQVPWSAVKFFEGLK